jgi:hypothetical protein
VNSPHDEHVVDLVADFVWRRLDEATLSRVRKHLETCSDCASDYAAAVVLRQAGEAKMHLDAERLTELSGASGRISPEERAHLESCDPCAHELDMLRGLGSAPSVSGLELELAPYPKKRELRRASSPSPRSRRLGWSVAALAVAAALILFIIPGRESVELGTMAVLEPMPVRVTRSSAEPGSFDEARLQALAAYGAANYVEALERLDLSLERRAGDPEMSLYRASALALTGRLDDARDGFIDLLADGDAVDAAMRDEARWQLVQVELLQTDRAGVEELLDELLARPGHREADARSLRAKLDVDAD